MLRKLTLSFFCFFTIFKSAGQPESNYPVCSLDDVPVAPSVIASQAIYLAQGDVLRDYLREIKGKLYIANSQYVIKNITQKQTACAINLKNGRVIERIIAINEAYYAAKVNAQLKKAMFIWIIGHELTHHINADHFYLNEKDELKNITKETLCDENAGYLVGALTNDVTLRELSIILSSILKNNESSIYYPPLQYRIYAAQAGWLRAKTEQWLGNQTEEVLGSKIIKTVEIDSKGLKKILIRAETEPDTANIERQEFEEGSLYFGLSERSHSRHGYGIYLSKSDSIETIYNIMYGKWEESDPKVIKKITQSYIYNGDYNKSKKNGKGEMIWIESEKKGDRYVGQFIDGFRTGFGIYFYNTGNRYVGEWLKGNKHGYGVLYNGDKVISAGCWRDNNFIGEDCKSEK